MLWRGKEEEGEKKGEEEEVEEEKEDKVEEGQAMSPTHKFTE
jgi:hypothetical protein